MATFEVRYGDLDTSLVSTLTKRDGSVYVLQGTETITVTLTDFNGTIILGPEAAVITTAGLGKVSYPWDADDFGAAGLKAGGIYYTKWVVTAGGSPGTFPTVPGDLLVAVYVA